MHAVLAVTAYVANTDDFAARPERAIARSARCPSWLSVNQMKADERGSRELVQQQKTARQVSLGRQRRARNPGRIRDR
jgi:hypothetical protein